MKWTTHTHLAKASYRITSSSHNSHPLVRSIQNHKTKHIELCARALTLSLSISRWMHACISSQHNTTHYIEITAKWNERDSRLFFPARTSLTQCGIIVRIGEREWKMQSNFFAISVYDQQRKNIAGASEKISGIVATTKKNEKNTLKQE